ncbi:MAG: FmdB family zinc ribbon protein [Planctomycetaceae bacterium]
MPLFEYVCRECERSYELLIRGDDPARCPQCGSEQADKLLSAPAAHATRAGRFSEAWS